MTGDPRTAQDGHRRTAWLRRAPTLVSLGLLALVGLCYLVRFDACAAVTVFPAWTWLIPGAPLVLPELWRGRRRVAVGVLGLWCLFAVGFADAPLSLARGLWTRGNVPDGRRVRVVTLNCATSAKAVAEVARFRPDIVLLQESPGQERLRELAAQLFGEEGGLVRGPDASILARGRLRPIDLRAGRRGDCVGARVQLPSGDEVAVVSLRLLPAPVRADLWSRACWKEYAENRRARRRELRAIVAEIEALPPSLPLIVGGDFNAAPNDPVFRLLRPRLADAFRRAGVGWGNTIANDWPVLRIDQVWASRRFVPHGALAVRTRHSDHRMVVCDLELSER